MGNARWSIDLTTYIQLVFVNQTKSASHNFAGTALSGVSPAVGLSLATEKADVTGSPGAGGKVSLEKPGDVV